MNISVVLGAAVVVGLALWSADHSRLTRDAALQSAKATQVRWDELADDYSVIRLELESRAELQKQLAEIGRTTQLLNDTLDGQTALINRNLAELKRNDKAIADYLGGLVPVALGMRYARPETTDPAAYRAAASSVQSVAVPPPGAPGAGSQ